MHRKMNKNSLRYSIEHGADERGLAVVLTIIHSSQNDNIFMEDFYDTSNNKSSAEVFERQVVNTWILEGKLSENGETHLNYQKLSHS